MSLIRLALLAHRVATPLALVHGAAVPLPDPPGRMLPLVGVRLGPPVDAVAARLGFGTADRPPAVLAVGRTGRAVVHDPRHRAPLQVDDEASVALDAARRCLGLTTPPPERSVVELFDTEWLARMLAITLAAPLGEPPDWAHLIRLYPSVEGAGGLPPSTEALAHHRRAALPRWDEVRLQAIEGRGPFPVAAWLAAWFDTGSLARHLFAVLPEASVVAADLAELLRPADAERLARVLGVRG